MGKVRDAAARVTEVNNMKQISIGALDYAGNNQKLPPVEGNVSWRVHILPFIEQETAFKQVDLNQPWNAGRNQSLAGTAIATYTSPLDDPGTTQTHYRSFAGTGTAFDPDLIKQRPFPLYITDGSSQTILAIDTAESIPWPQPKEIPFSPSGSIPELGHPKRPQGIAAMCDGSVRTFDKKMDPATIRALVTATGGETIPEW